MKKRIVCLLIVAAIAQDLFAQDEHDALRFSYTINQGTARGLGIGGAVGSIGADFSALSVNPAGIGIYKSSEFMLTPSFSVSHNTGDYLGSSNSANSSKFNLSNLGMIITSKSSQKSMKKSGWRTVNFGFGMNRMATFKNEYVYSGKNFNSSLIESYADDFNSLGGINSTSLGQVNFSAYGAYQTYLIDLGLGADSNKAVSYVPYNDGLIQTKRVTETGHLNEYLISVGGNYMDRLMLGASMGISSVKYNRTLHFNEEDASNNLNNDFNYMYFTERLSTTGTGINLKVGAIYKPSAYFRCGLALHTPTHIELNDASSVSMESHTDSLIIHSGIGTNPVSIYNQDSALVFNYSLNTPYKAILSGMFLFGKMGFVTADLEYVDYASMRYKYGIGYEKETDVINRVIQNTYQDAINVRLGAEARLNNFSLRGGFAYYGSPYKSGSFGSKKNISAGIGYRDQAWYLDATYVYAMQTLQEVPYIIARTNANVQNANIDNRRGNVLITLGVKF